MRGVVYRAPEPWSLLTDLFWPSDKARSNSDFLLFTAEVSKVSHHTSKGRRGLLRAMTSATCQDRKGGLDEPVSLGLGTVARGQEIGTGPRRGLEVAVASTV